MSYERILLDIETQRDFFVRGGSCYTKDARSAIRHIYQLFGWARRYRVPVLSTVLRVRPNEQGPLAPTPHCVEGTPGEAKLTRTIIRPHLNLGLLNTTDLPVDLFELYRQAIFEKRHTDIFAHARAERLLTELSTATFVVCGAGLAHGIVQAAVGLRARGFGVICARDAVLDLNDELADMAYRRMEAKGVVFAPTTEIVAPTLKRKVVPFRTTAEAR